MKFHFEGTNFRENPVRSNYKKRGFSKEKFYDFGKNLLKSIFGVSLFSKIKGLKKLPHPAEAGKS